MAPRAAMTHSGELKPMMATAWLGSRPSLGGEVVVYKHSSTQEHSTGRKLLIHMRTGCSSNLHVMLATLLWELYKSVCMYTCNLKRALFPWSALWRCDGPQVLSNIVHMGLGKSSLSSSHPMTTKDRPSSTSLIHGVTKQWRFLLN